jgi:hypothetical protein
LGSLLLVVLGDRSAPRVTGLMATTFARQYKAETVERMAENIEHIAQVVFELGLEPPALGAGLRNAAFYLRKALELWPKD